MAYTKEQLADKYRNLPEDVKNVLDSVELIDLVIKTCSNFKLHIDQQGELTNEIGLVLLGVTKPELFLSNIQTRLNIDATLAGEIAKQINQNVFFPIRESLEKMNNGGLEKYKAEQAPKVENFSPAGNISNENIQKPSSPLPTIDNNAIIIGSTAPIDSNKSAEQKIFDDKMGKLFRLPKEEVDLGAPKNETPTKSADPYREPIN